MANPIQGYFNSTSYTLDVNGFPIWNRAVGSTFMAKFAHTALGNGAAAVTTGGFQVVKKTGMTVTVKPYFICKDGYMMYQTGETDITFTSSASEQVFYIGARLDVANNHFYGDDVGAFTTFVSATDIASCKLTITANAVTITDGMITDLRYDTNYCGQIDEYRERSLALIAKLEDALAAVIAGGVPDHASTHASDGSDPITPASILAVGGDGWVPANESWAYASATTITVPSGATSKYRKGDKIKLKQTTVKFFSIVGVADTVLTITAGSTYTLTNAAITENCFSKVENPQGFPEYFTLALEAWTTFGTAFTNQPMNGYWRFRVIGSFINIFGNAATHATSGGTSIFKLNITAGQIPTLQDSCGCAVNHTAPFALTCTTLAASPNVINIYKYDGSTPAGNSQSFGLSIVAQY